MNEKYGEKGKLKKTKWARQKEKEQNGKRCQWRASKTEENWKLKRSIHKNEKGKEVDRNRKRERNCALWKGNRKIERIDNENVQNRKAKYIQKQNIKEKIKEKKKKKTTATGTRERNWPPWKRNDRKVQIDNEQLQLRSESEVYTKAK